MEYPLRIESYGFVENSGGPGKHRGGLGIRRVIRPVDHVATFSGQGERFVKGPWGIFGGGPGAPGQFMLVQSNGSTRPLSTKPSGVLVQPTEAVVVETPGAGGYGLPSQRAPNSISEDRRSGKFSSTFLKIHYPHSATHEPDADDTAPRSQGAE